MSEPRIVKPLPAPLAYAAMESARNAVIEPVKRDGVPIDGGFV